MWFFQVLDPDSVITFSLNVFRIQDGTRLSFTVITIFINKFSPHDLSLCRSSYGPGGPCHSQRASEACGERPLKPGAARGAHLRRGPPGGPGCHRGCFRGARGGSGGDARCGVPGGRKGGGALGNRVAAAQASRRGWINRGPRRFRLHTVPEENIVPDSAPTEVWAEKVVRARHICSRSSLSYWLFLIFSVFLYTFFLTKVAIL